MRERKVQHAELVRKLATRAPEVVIYEDSGLLVVNKPPGVLAHVNRGKPGVQEAVREGVGQTANVAHRLDQYTSGVMLVAKTLPALNHLRRLFEDRTVGNLEKVYTALVDGEFPNGDQVTVDVPLQKVGHCRMRVVYPGADTSTSPHPVRDSLTHFNPKTLYSDQHEMPRTVTEVTLVTGRQHQIRVVAADYLLTPVVGDALYGFTTPYVPRHMLHATSMTLPLPGTEEQMTFVAPFPADFEEAVGKLTMVKEY